MQVRKTRAISVNLEHCAITSTAAVEGRSIQDIARQNQAATGNIAATWIGSVTVGEDTRRISLACRETIQIRITRAIGVDGENRAAARTAAPIRRAIKEVAR